MGEASILSGDVLAVALSASPEAIVLVDAAGLVAYANPAAGRLAGVAERDLVGHPSDLLYPDMDPQEAESGFRVVRETGRAHRFRLSSPRRELWIDVSPAGESLLVTLRREAPSAEVLGFRSTLDELPEHVVTMRGPDLVYDFANEAFLAFSGLRRSQIVGLRVAEAWPVPPEHVAQLRHVFETGETISGREVPVPYPSEPERIGYFDYAFRPLRDLSGQVSGILVYSLDVTDKVEAREKLARSEERYRTLFETATVGIVYQDGDARIIDANPAAQRILGLTLDQMQGRSSFDPRWRAVREDFSDYPGDQHPVPLALASGTIERGIMGIFHPQDEAYRWIDITAVPQTRAGETRPYLIYALFEDITERRNAQIALSEEQRRLAQALNLGRVMTYDWDVVADRCVRSQNAEELLLVPGAQVTQGSTFLSMVHPADQDRLAALSDQLRPGRDAYQEEFRLVRPDGSVLWVQDSAKIEYGPDGQITRIHGLMADITERRRTLEELERIVQARTAELLAKNEELESFTYSVSHDLRAPLRGIVANARILLEEQSERLDAVGQMNLARLATAATKMGTLVDDLLHYARLGRREVRVEPIDLAAMVREMVDDLRREHDCELVLTMPPALPAVGDPRFLGLALRNLVDNACKYRKPGEPARVEIGHEGDAYYVRDQGIGFDMAFAGKLFVPFERLHPDTEYAGTGIGLANVRRAIERHGGRIWADSNPGQGATFWFTLPDASA